jgi:hypothetical protein
VLPSLHCLRQKDLLAFYVSIEECH